MNTNKNLSNEFIRKMEESGRPAELLAIKLLEQKGWNVLDVADIAEHYHTGDLIISKNKFSYHTDVKNDYQIGLTGNFFFEVSTKRNNYTSTGWFVQANYDILMFNNSKDNIMYILDYHVCQQKVDKLYHKITGEIWNKNEKAYCVGKLVNVKKAIENGLVKSEIHYNSDGIITDYIKYPKAS